MARAVLCGSIHQPGNPGAEPDVRRAAWRSAVRCAGRAHRRVEARDPPVLTTGRPHTVRITSPHSYIWSPRTRSTDGYNPRRLGRSTMRIVQLLTAVIACAGVPAIQAATPPSAEAYGRLPAISSVALSPDGKRVVISVGYEYRASEPDRELTSLSIIDLDTGKVEKTLAPPPKNNLRGVGWADDKRPYYFISSTGRARDALPPGLPVMSLGPRVEWFRTGVLSLETGASTLLM